MKGRRGKRKTGTERTRTAAAKQRKVAERQRNKGRDEQVARTMVGRGGGGTGDEVGKDGVWMESRGEDRREEEEEVAKAGRVSVCKRFLRRGD